ncbi:hypothetical protein MMC12_000347 [Toensbergia leucococca]|nr:hypothetical protein [Toensbergia leucococca]
MASAISAQAISVVSKAEIERFHELVSLIYTHHDIMAGKRLVWSRRERKRQLDLARRAGIPQDAGLDADEREAFHAKQREIKQQRKRRSNVRKKKKQAAKEAENAAKKPQG